MTQIGKRIQRDIKKLEEGKNDPGYTDEQRQLYRDRLDELSTEKQARLEILSQNWKDLQTQVVKIRQTLKKVLDKDMSLAERIRPYFLNKALPYFQYWLPFQWPSQQLLLPSQLFLEEVEGQ